MPVFGFLAVFAIGLFIFYRAKTLFRSLPPYEYAWTRAKAQIALAAFLIFFATNQLLNLTTKVALVVNIIFMVLGIASAIQGIKKYRYYTPLAIDEAQNKSE